MSRISPDGKTVTLQGLAEGFARAGVPVFLADVKGDIAGMAKAGSEAAGWTAKRAMEMKMEDYDWESMPVVFWDLFGEQGHPIRTTISEMGPLLLSRLMGLNDTQEGVLTIAFRYAENVNGSARNIAGVLNAAGNVLGMMPHPERMTEAVHGGSDGRRLFEGLIRQIA